MTEIARVMSDVDTIDDIALSKYGKASCVPSPVSEMMTAFAADFRDDADINLGVGYVNQETIPAGRIKDAFEQVLLNPGKYRKALNYGGPQGSPNLIESVRRFYAENGIGGLTEEVFLNRKILIGPNGSTSLLDSIAQALKPGIVITIDPMYYAYCNFLERLGYSILTVPEDGEGMSAEALMDKLDALGDEKSRISYFYIPGVNNPSSTIITNNRRRKLVEIATRLSREISRKVPLFFDIAYEQIIHEPDVPPVQSGILFDKLGIVYDIGSLSKVIAPALRIGYMICPENDLTEALIQRTSDAAFSAPLITQEIASYLLDTHGPAQFEHIRKGYREKALKVKGWLDGILRDYVQDYRGGKAAFYFYVTMKEGIDTRTGSDFYKFLMRKTGNAEIDQERGVIKSRVMYIPGVNFVHPEGDMVEEGKRQFRLSYGYESIAKMERAMHIMRDAAEYALEMKR